MSDHWSKRNSSYSCNDLLTLDQVVSDLSLYLNTMSKNKTFGDHLTLQAASELFDVQVIVLSSKGNSYNRLITKSSSEVLDQCRATVLLGHFAEDDGTYYVCLSPNANTGILNTFSSKVVSSTQRNVDRSQCYEGMLTLKKLIFLAALAK